MTNITPGTLVRVLSSQGDRLGIVRLDGKIVIPDQGKVLRSSARAEVVEASENTSALLPLEISRLDFEQKQLFDFALKCMGLSSPFDQPKLAGQEE